MLLHDTYIKYMEIDDASSISIHLTEAIIYVNK